MLDATQLTELSVEDKRELLKMLLSLRTGDATGFVPLSFGQQSLWFLYHLAPQSPAYNFLFAAKLSTTLHLPALLSAGQALVARHPILRAQFVLQERTPMYRVQPTVTLDIPVHEVEHCTLEQILDQCRQRADVPFQLETGPLLRIEVFRKSAHESVLLFVCHHIVADLWSMDVLIDELHQLYTAQVQQTTAHLPDLKASYADYVRWQITTVHGPRGQRAWQHWHQLLAGEQPVLALPTDHPRPPMQTYTGTSHSWLLESSTVQKVREMSREQGTTPFMTLLGAFQVLLSKLSGQQHFLIGTATADRSRPEWEHVVGYFLNQVVLRAQLGPEQSFTNFLQQVRTEVHQALDHQEYPFNLLVKRLQPRREPSRSPFFQVMFIWDEPRTIDIPGLAPSAKRGHDPHWQLEPMLMEQRGAPFDLTFIIFAQEDGLKASFRYNSDLFEADTIRRFAGYFDTLLSQLLAHPQTPLSELSLLNVAEKQQLLVEANRTVCPYPQQCFYQIFEHHAAQTPGQLALVFDEQSWTYNEVNRQANQLARRLALLGVQKGDVVALSTARCPQMMIALLAIWKAGAAYVFLDPAYPRERLAHMLQTAAPVALLANGAYLETTLPTLQLNEACTESAYLSDSNLSLSTQLDEPAYLIFTSGSTGKPKGTLLRHRGLSSLVEAFRRVYGLAPTDRSLQFASLSFDASVYELVSAWGFGATLVVASSMSAMPGEALSTLLRHQAVTVAVLPPSVLAVTPADDLPDLRILMAAGEACSADLVKTWGTGRRFLNGYGPTEATIWATVAECQPDGTAPSIGKPIPNTQVYVLDAHLQPVPTQVAGELYLSAPGLALGYLGQPGLTAEKFIPNPFSTVHEGVLYRTGDLVRWRIDGQLDFLGRCDQQVKLRGYRIELDEIQEVLRMHPSVADAAVLTKVNGGGLPALAAYVVPKTNVPFALAELRTHMRDRLPHYMLPAHVLPLERLPLTVNGKVDRQALLALTHEPTSPRETTNPSTPAEKLLVQIWKKVLNVENVGIHEAFFELGGASIQVLEMVRLAEPMGLALTPEMVFRAQTIAELAPLCSPSQAVHESDTAMSPSATQPVNSGLLSSRSAQQTAVTLVESLGVYLPAREVTTEQILRDCRIKLDFPLEKMTGIRSRRMAGDTEFSLDLAEKAAQECLKRSRYHAQDIDLLICCNISRFDGPNYRFSYEPTTSAVLCARLGLSNALAFDISNACAGTFTGLRLIDTFLRQGLVRRAMLVSGEYITHLTRTAQLEIESFMDARMACLTLGDAGAALILEHAPSKDVGFQDLELYTLGQYHDLCVAKSTQQQHGGAIMVTDAVKGAAVTIKQAVHHSLDMLQRHRWPVELVNWIIMHQTSETTLDGAVREINRVVGKPVCSRTNTLYNVANRGNPATNSHFLALWENIQAGKVADGDRVLFAVSGSGQTVGTALYVLDDLPSRIRQKREPVRAEPAPLRTLHWHTCRQPTRIESVGLLAPSDTPVESISALKQAGEACLQASARPRSSIDLVLHTGVYRSEFLSEPALAAIAAGELQINSTEETSKQQRSLAFDLVNGGAGTLTACFLASALLEAQQVARVLVLASEVENNRTAWPEHCLPLHETASAVILEPGTGEGFLCFGFRQFPEHLAAAQSYTQAHNFKPALKHERAEDYETRLLSAIASTVTEFLQKAQVERADISAVVPSHRSRAFVQEMSAHLGIALDRFVHLPDPDRDYFTSSLAFGWAEVQQWTRLAKGQLVLFVECAAGVQVGCALYRV